MAKGIIPIIRIRAKPVIGIAIEEIMESHEVKAEDPFTYTTRYEVPDEAKRSAIRSDLAKRVESNELDAEEVKFFLKVMDETNWDCSFLVDTY